MERTIRKIEHKRIVSLKVTRVAAYARVSSGKDAMLHSLSAQISYYNDMIQKHPGWMYCGVYADEAITGTKDNRENFQKLLAACRRGEVDLVITKSLSRLARNTVTLLETVRELKSLGVDVFFEEQNIHTMSSNGELMLTILASYAQEESLSTSESMKWRIRKNFEQGIPWVGFLLGYRIHNGEYEVVPAEAETVKRIFDSYLDGMGYIAICKSLNEDGVITRDGNEWQVGHLMRVLSNYCYTGNLLLQRRYRENHITKRSLFNHGELPMYHALDTHEAIIPLETFEAVQAERAKRAEKFSSKDKRYVEYPFTHRIFCSCCGAPYNRKTAKGKKIWICRTYNTAGKSKCPKSRAVPEKTIEWATCEVLALDEFDPQVFTESVERITAEPGNVLSFLLRDGTCHAVKWEDESRADSWTPEMKEAARQKTLQRRNG